MSPVQNRPYAARPRPEVPAVLIAQELSTAPLASSAVKLYMSIHVRAVHLQADVARDCEAVSAVAGYARAQSSGAPQHLSDHDS